MKAWLLRHLPNGPWIEISRIVFITVLIVVLIWGLGANLTTESKTEALLRQYHAQTLKSDKITTQRTAQLDAIAANITLLLTNGKSASAVNAREAKVAAQLAAKEAKLLLADHTSTATSLNTTLELVAVVQEELEAFFPGKTLKVTCGLSKASDLECKVTKTPKENR